MVAITLVRSLVVIVPSDKTAAGRAGRLLYLPGDAATHLRIARIKLQATGPGVLVNADALSEFLMALASTLGQESVRQLSSLCLQGMRVDASLSSSWELASGGGHLSTLELHQCDVLQQVPVVPFLQKLQNLYVQQCTGLPSLMMMTSQLTGLTCLECDMPFNWYNVMTTLVRGESWVNLKVLRLPQVELHGEEMDCLLTRAPHLEVLELRSVTSPVARDLKALPCSLKELILRGTLTLKPLAALPLGSLQLPFMAPPNRLHIELYSPDKVENMRAAVDNLLSCPTLSADMCLHLVFIGACNGSVLEPLKALRHHVGHLGVEDHTLFDDEMSEMLQDLFGGLIPFLDWHLVESNSLDFLIEQQQSFENLVQLNLVFHDYPYRLDEAKLTKLVEQRKELWCICLVVRRDMPRVIKAVEQQVKGCSHALERLGVRLKVDMVERMQGWE